MMHPFYLMWWSFIVQYISRPSSSLNGEKISDRKVKQQFAHRKMQFSWANFEQNNFIWYFSAVWTIILLRNIKHENVLLNNFFSNFNLEKHYRILLWFKIKNSNKWQDFEIGFIIFNFTKASLLLLATIMRVCFARNYWVP